MVALTSFFRFLLTRDLSSAPGEPGQNITVFSLLGGTSAAILFSTFLLGFSLLFAFLHVCLVRVPACRRLDGKTRAQASAWISASVHHAVVVAVALACIACDVSEGPPVDARTVATFVPLSLAYIASDFFATCVPELREGKWEMTLHHVMGFIISAATLIAPPFILRFAPYMWLCEASNLGLGVSWAAMKLWGRGGRVQKIAEGYFVVSFVRRHAAPSLGIGALCDCACSLPLALRPSPTTRLLLASSASHS